MNNFKRKKILIILFWILSLTWNFIMSFIGLTVALILIIKKYKPCIFQGSIYFEVGENWGGINLGPVFVTSKNSSLSTKIHESGHGVQGTFLGPLFPFLIAIPSGLRYQYRNYIFKKNEKKYFTLPDYNSIWFEASADYLGQWYFDL